MLHLTVIFSKLLRPLYVPRKIMEGFGRDTNASARFLGTSFQPEGDGQSEGRRLSACSTCQKTFLKSIALPKADKGKPEVEKKSRIFYD